MKSLIALAALALAGCATTAGNAPVDPIDLCQVVCDKDAAMLIWCGGDRARVVGTCVGKSPRSGIEI